MLVSRWLEYGCLYSLQNAIGDAVLQVVGAIVCGSLGHLCDDCACFLVEAIAKKSQNIKWETTVDGQKMGHRLIRRVSLDQFYALVTGQDDAFYQMCLVLPKVIQNVVETEGTNLIPHDTVMDDLLAIAAENGIENKDLAVSMAIYLLGFSSYNGFTKDN